jgi:hypothetical protein
VRRSIDDRNGPDGRGGRDGGGGVIERVVSILSLVVDFLEKTEENLCDQDCLRELGVDGLLSEIELSLSKFF